MSPEGPRLPKECDALAAQLHEESGAGRLGVSPGTFSDVLRRSVGKRFGAGASASQIEVYLRTLHAEDLALACACAEGLEAAWGEFVAKYRGYLRSAAAAILRCPAGAPEANELADSLFAELYGLADGKRGERSLFRYFHGRSSLKTWLRAVLAQRRIDAVRANRRFEPLEGPDGEAKHEEKLSIAAEQTADPDRTHYLKLFEEALGSALAELTARDAERLRLYYVREQTLAEIGRKLGEHESSVCRNLDRVRHELRQRVEDLLRSGIRADANREARGLSDAQIALCFEYATGETSMDLEKLFGQKPRNGRLPQKRET